MGTMVAGWRGDGDCSCCCGVWMGENVVPCHSLVWTTAAGSSLRATGAAAAEEEDDEEQRKSWRNSLRNCLPVMT